MADIGPGDWLECIRDDGFQGFHVHCGRLYQVAQVGRHPPHSKWGCNVCGRISEADAIDLVGYPVHPYWVWCPCCFRPTDRRPGDAAVAALKSHLKVLEPA